MKMTSRERLLAAMRNRETDHVPCGPFGIARLDINAPLTQELIRRTDPFLKGAIKGGGFLGKRAEVEVRKTPKETVRIIKTPGGNLVKRVGHTDIATATVEYPLKELDDIDKLLSVEYEEPEPDPSGYFAMKEKYDDEGLVLCGIGNAVCVPAEWFGPEKFCLFWATDREKIVELTKIASERVCGFVRRCCELGATDFRIVGGEYVTTQIGPSGMKDLIIGPDRKLIDIIHQYDGVAFYHNHGPMMNFLEDCAAIGVDFLEPLEAPPWGDTHLGRAKEIIGDRYCMVGNMDDMEIVDKLDAEQVRTIARERIEQAGRRGFVLSGTASGTFTEKAAKNFIEMAEVAKECKG
jgi:uroporphyrinogen-III decarboxylase